MSTEKRLDVILLYIPKDGQRLAFYVGEGELGFIPVFFTWECARELAAVMERKFDLSLGFAALKQVSQDSLEKNCIKAFPKPLNYSFVYEGTPEFEALAKKVK